MSWFQRMRQFLVEVWAELQKTSWPTLREVRGTTIVVIISVIIFAVYLFVVDKTLETALQRVFAVFTQ